MAEYRTPSHKKAELDIPSVFMTPSSSCGKPVFKHPQSLLLNAPVPPLPFPSLEQSPSPTEQNVTPSPSLATPKATFSYKKPVFKRPLSHLLTTSVPPLSLEQSPSPTEQKATRHFVNGEEFYDIITGLCEGEVIVPMLVDDILSMLDNQGIKSCLLVCKSWNEHISIRYPPKSLSQAITDENSMPLPSIKSQRTALAILSSNAAGNPKSSLSLKRPSTNNPGPPATKLRPCPQCQSPAKKLNIRRAECTKCSFDFCQKCFGSWHEESSCGGAEISPLSPKKTKTLTVGTKKSKKRLRRL